MNHKGQTLVAFIIIVPIFILLLAFVVDTGYLFMEYTKLQSITKTILKITYKEKETKQFEEKIFSLYEKNNIPTNNLEIENGEQVKVSNQYEIESIFGKIIGLNSYKVKTKMRIYFENDKFVITKE